MGQPVKLSDALVMEGRIAGDAMQRSIAGQVEFWARIGNAVEQVMTGGQIANLQHKVSHRELMELIEEVGTLKGRERLEAYLKTTPFPRYWAHPTEAWLFLREEADGTETVGKFEGRKWVPRE